MAGASSRWFLNGVDTFLAYGFAVMEGQAAFLSFPKRKDSLSHSWAEENGVEIDLGLPRFEAKEVRLKCVFIAPDEQAYWANRNAFFAALAAPGWQQWQIADHGKTYSVYYKESNNFRLVTKRLKTEQEVVCTFELVLVASDELIPNEATNGDPVYIRDQNGTLIITKPPGSTYTVQSITQIHGGNLSQGDEQYTPLVGLIQGEPL
ncbi:hypothetical protein Q4E40_02545 [Pontibacter sp. BT731]|uniref:hypothetical protein n=1 Tax=Pontibacter coccineus TaxID=3063328 RepID=UPI0026E3BC39|nr:hypothetical protein [Pontibacter sp. BT731]MDO6388991.1 hypothetical protein [Pontibacter sp. BT731]